jgi:hypothetical protein
LCKGYGAVLIGRGAKVHQLDHHLHRLCCVTI